jgi:hypothetical protein
LKTHWRATARATTGGKAQLGTRARQRLVPSACFGSDEMFSMKNLVALFVWLDLHLFRGALEA